ncbi:hypothetical protein D3C72_1418350 [compost metagenome]
MDLLRRRLAGRAVGLSDPADTDRHGAHFCLRPAIPGAAGATGQTAQQCHHRRSCGGAPACRSRAGHHHHPGRTVRHHSLHRTAAQSSQPGSCRLAWRSVRARWLAAGRVVLVRADDGGVHHVVRRTQSVCHRTQSGHRGRAGPGIAVEADGTACDRPVCRALGAQGRRAAA